MASESTAQSSPAVAGLTPRPLGAVTGASSGIGRELARQFAQHGFDLVVAADGPDIADAARELETLGARTEGVQVDLSTPEGVEELYARIAADGRPLEAIAINAGVGNAGEFAEIPLEDELRLIGLNVVHPVHLAKRVVPDMIARGQGRILLTSSVAATMPGPHYATYAASRSFVQSLAEALRVELKDRGVSVTALQPGPTETSFFARAGLENTRVGSMTAMQDDPADVARQGFEAMMQGKDSVVAGSLVNKVQTAVSRVLPETVSARLHGKQTEQRDL